MTSPTPRYSRPLIATAVLVAASVSSAWAVPFIRTIEKDIETSTSDVSIPGSAPSTVLVPICGKVCPNSLALTTRTQAFIGTKPVTLGVLHDYTTSHRVGMTLFYDPVSKELNRVIADETRN